MLVKGKFPAKHTIACPGELVPDYVRNPDAAQIVENGRLDLLTAYDDELNYGVDYWYWDFASNLKFGCAFGGTIKYVPTNRGSNLVLKDCAFVDGSTATGTGVIDDSAGFVPARCHIQWRLAWERHVSPRAEWKPEPERKSELHRAVASSRRAPRPRHECPRQ